MPDVEIICPDCGGKRYSDKAGAVKIDLCGKDYSIAELMRVTIGEAAKLFEKHKKIKEKLETIASLGLDYLTLGESTPSLSGGEAQRLKLAAEMGKTQSDAVFVFDEPTIGLHPQDVGVLLEVFDKLIGNGATVVVIEHDLDVIKNADYIIDMGPRGGVAGGRIVAEGTPEDIKNSAESITGKYL